MSIIYMNLKIAGSYASILTIRANDRRVSSPVYVSRDVTSHVFLSLKLFVTIGPNAGHSVLV